MSVALSELAAHLDELLALDDWRDADKSLNGLQVEGDERVDSVALAVDGCRETFEDCAGNGERFLFVHHGLFWGKPLAITGHHRGRVKTLLDAGISLYAAHFPLDFHDELGHNARLLEQLGLSYVEPLIFESGRPVGRIAESGEKLKLEELVRRIESRLDTDCRTLAFGPDTVRRVGIIAGEGAKLLDEPLSRRLDTFVTGEESHTVYHFARELGVNVIFAGHYATEVPGLTAVGEHLQREFGLPWRLIAAPTGL